MAFLIAFGIIGLAIAFVIGQAASRLVTAFVNDIIDPTIGLFLPAGSLDNLALNVTGIHGAPSEFKYGDLISTIIDFVIISLIECVLSDYRWHTPNSIDDNILEFTERRSFSHALVFNVCILCHGNNWRHRIWLQFCLES